MVSCKEVRGERQEGEHLPLQRFRTSLNPSSPVLAVLDDEIRLSADVSEINSKWNLTLPDICMLLKGFAN